MRDVALGQEEKANHTILFIVFSGFSVVPSGKYANYTPGETSRFRIKTGAILAYLSFSYSLSFLKLNDNRLALRFSQKHMPFPIE
jgi:hypothetical protein